jgi:hypothetical protein
MLSLVNYNSSLSTVLLKPYKASYYLNLAGDIVKSEPNVIKGILALSGFGLTPIFEKHNGRLIIGLRPTLIKKPLISLLCWFFRSYSRIAFLDFPKTYSTSNFSTLKEIAIKKLLSGGGNQSKAFAVYLSRLKDTSWTNYSVGYVSGIETYIHAYIVYSSSNLKKYRRFCQEYNIKSPIVRTALSMPLKVIYKYYEENYGC